MLLTIKYPIIYRWFGKLKRPACEARNCDTEENLNCNAVVELSNDDEYGYMRQKNKIPNITDAGN